MLLVGVPTTNTERCPSDPELLGVTAARDQQLDQVVLGAVVSWYSFHEHVA